MNISRLSVLTSKIIVTALLAGSTLPAYTGENAEQSLYDRLGGVYSIAPIVDYFIERVLVNDALNANPAVREALDRVPKAGLKFQVTALICEVAGGPEKYHGRTMKASHAHLNITESEWQVMVDDYQKALNKFEVPKKEQAELLTILEDTKPHIVVSQ